jgi:(S)-ureidoglycine aminohydrolase
MSTPLGQTRSVIARDHALIAPDSHVIAPLPGWRHTPGVILISPQMGAGLTQYLAMLRGDSASALPGEGIERFIFVREGEASLAVQGKHHALRTGGYAFIPPDTAHEITSTGAGTLLIFEKRYEPIEGAGPPPAVVGHVGDRRVEAFMGDNDAMLATLLPGDASFDLAVNLFTFNPGAALPLVEVHIFEHGLLMMKGAGVYRLGNDWMPVLEGDAIWMGPYCPQWFCAYGKTPAQYIYSKNVNRPPSMPR